MNLVASIRKEKWVNHLLSLSKNIYIVGGCVRDIFLKKKIKDIDFLIEGYTNIEELKQILQKFGKVNIAGEFFSVIKFRPNNHVGEDYDIAIPRIDKKVGVGHRGFTAITDNVTVLDDLKRRDFTINSIAINIETGQVLDPFNGKSDIRNKLLRATDKRAFVEDPLRILRGIQFAARFNLDVEPETLKLMKQNSKLINEISGERILDEFNKILYKNGNVEKALWIIYNSDIDKALFNKKFDTSTFKHMNDLDPISFYYMLGILGGVSPSKFYDQKIRGLKTFTKALKTLEENIDDLENERNESELRWKVFLMLKTSPILIDSMILPPNATSVLTKMKNGTIPTKFGDIPITGNDIMKILDIQPGLELGIVITKLYKGALMNEYNWKSTSEILEFLTKIKSTIK